MKARIIDIAELKKRPEEREAQDLLNQLNPEKAIEITLTGQETTRKAARIYRKVAQSLGKDIRVNTKEGKIIVRLK